MQAGAQGYLLKGAEQEEIAHAIRAVAARPGDFGPASPRGCSATSPTPGPAPTDAFPELTAREREILELLAHGRRTADDRPRRCTSRPRP